MKDRTDWNEIEILPRTLGLTDATADARERRELLLMLTGGRTVGIFADEADSVSENLRPTPLPYAPPAVVGVVSVRGRMRTVLDPAMLLGAGAAEPSGEPARFIVSLRGDEQLALRVERVERIVEILTEDVQSLTQATGVVRGFAQHGSSTVILLDPARLFEAATQGAERRRKR